jgi:hypothetical protein
VLLFDADYLFQSKNVDLENMVGPVEVKLRCLTRTKLRLLSASSALFSAASSSR